MFHSIYPTLGNTIELLVWEKNIFFPYSSTLWDCGSSTARTINRVQLQQVRKLDLTSIFQHISLNKGYLAREIRWSSMMSNGMPLPTKKNHSQLIADSGFFLEWTLLNRNRVRNNISLSVYRSYCWRLETFGGNRVSWSVSRGSAAIYSTGSEVGFSGIRFLGKKDVVE